MVHIFPSFPSPTQLTDTSFSRRSAAGPECRHGLSGERSSWLLFVVGLESPVPTVSALPVSSVPEVFDRWSPGERSELIGSEFLDVLASVPD
ncbi:hypothetical protein OSH49_24335, partial [Mycobacterium ulcerans]